MFTKNPSRPRRRTSAAPPDQAREPASPESPDWASVFANAERACCCPATPAVVAVFPARPGRSRPIDLLLCGHHYRACQAELAAAGAVIHRLPRSRP
jgi:hypothetical protein